MKSRTNTIVATFAFAALISGCAATASRELVEARNAYTISKNGLAAQMTPTDLYEAKKMLDKANREFDDNGDSVASRDLAYIAHRKISLADSKARAELDRKRTGETVEAGIALRDAQVKSGKVALAATRAALGDEQDAAMDLRIANEAQGSELKKSAAQLESEKQARQSAESELAGAMKDLAAIAKVKEEARGLVITLSGSVLFVTGSFSLLNTAKTKLDQVAEALIAQDADKHMVVEGYTDSQGSDAINQPLSLNRATAVRDYLVSRGVPSAKISAVGMGSSKPVAPNNTPENRANNRRVEIVVGSAKLSSR